MVDAVGRLLASDQIVGVGVACTWSQATALDDRVRAMLESVLSAWETRSG